jgi:hypothetical protein
MTKLISTGGFMSSKSANKQDANQGALEGAVPTSRRRGFLAGAATTGAAGVAAVVLAPKTITAPIESSEDSTSKGYHVSEHIRRYYRTTTV